MSKETRSLAGSSPESIESLVRMLNLIPYFESHPERSVMEAAQDLGRKPAEIMADLNRLWCCGLPGLMPDNLVDLQPSYTEVRISNNQGMDRPLRLTRTEAATLLLTLEVLEQSPGLIDYQAVSSAAAKLRALTGKSLDAIVDGLSSLQEEDLAQRQVEKTLSVVRQAVDESRKLRICYYGASEQSLSERILSPVHLFTHDGHSYITAYDHIREGYRHFRTDRIEDIEILDEPADKDKQRLKFDPDDPFNFGDIEQIVDILIQPDAVWLADYYPLTLGEAQADGQVAARMPIGSEAWFIRFALGNADRFQVSEATKLSANLRSQVRERALAGLGAYDQPTAAEKPAP